MSQGHVQGYMFRAAFMKRVPLFMRDFLENIVLCLVAAGVETTSKRFTDRIAVSWRHTLTSQIHSKYFNNMVMPGTCRQLCVPASATPVQSRLHQLTPSWLLSLIQSATQYR